MKIGVIFWANPGAVWSVRREELRQQFEAMRYTPPVAKRYDTTVLGGLQPGPLER